VNYAFHPEAEAEFVEAIEYYEAREIGLGLDFAAEVHAAIQRATTFPTAWQVVSQDVRRALVRRFPYGILYAIDAETILIVAVMNLHRAPNYWANRLT
jgi:plasmid stabilization system protein ParE